MEKWFEDLLSIKFYKTEESIEDALKENFRLYIKKLITMFKLTDNFVQFFTWTNKNYYFVVVMKMYCLLIMDILQK